ncbi:MAG: hypothetical protein ACK4NE_07020, partial [Albidovulum sp.]
MSEGQKPEESAETRVGFGLYTRASNEPAIGAAEIIAAVVSLIWLALVAGFFLFADGDGSSGPIGSVMVLVAIFLPIALIWIATITLRTARTMRDEAERLQAAIDAMRQAYVSQAQGGLVRSSVEKRLEEIAAAAKLAETAIVTFTSRRDGDAAPPPAERKAAFAPPGPAQGQRTDEQPALALGTPAETEAAPVSVADFIRALNFPD